MIESDDHYGDSRHEIESGFWVNMNDGDGGYGNDVSVIESGRAGSQKISEKVRKEVTLIHLA